MRGVAGAAVRLVPIAAADRPRLRERLAAAGLPADDLDGAAKRFCRAVRSDGTAVGDIGCEVYGADALIRSLLVEAAHRGAGVAREMLAALEARLARRGVGRVWLLTTSAAPLFDRLGYARVDRAAAPPAIRATSAFAGACPAGALCFTRPLALPAGTLGEA